MVTKLKFYKSETLNPYKNLATEKILLDTVEENCVILYLWQNENTVVIGKNQNPWAECNCSLLEAEGGFVARRLSGGGAVFHDTGNLNFTFISNKNDYNLEKHLEVITKACEYANIRAEISGRNDILVNERKFSGNAFYSAKGKSYHHGTLLISSDSDKISRYLTPSSEKLSSKGVKSVRSRVISLNEINSNLTPSVMADYMLKAFESVYKINPEEIIKIENEKNAEYTELFGSWDFIYGKALPFGVTIKRYLSFGNIELKLNISGGKITAIKCYTDAMDYTLSEKTEAALNGCRLDKTEIENRLNEKLEQRIATDILKLLEDEII